MRVTLLGYKHVETSKQLLLILQLMNSAPWTFDPARLLACLKTLKDQVILM